MNGPTVPAWIQALSTDPGVAVTVAVLALTVLALSAVVLRSGVRLLARVAGDTDRADLLTYLAASIATGVATQGMWNFFGDVLQFPPVLRVGMFAFFEIAVIASAVRARRTMREHASAGVDAIAVWVLTSLSAVFSAMDASSFPEAVFRLAAPLVAAWLWERGMAVERRRVTGRTGIHWALTPERVLVRLGLAEPSGRTAGQVDTQRRLTGVAVAVKHARRLQAAGTRGWRYRRALTRLDAALHQAVTHAALATDPAQQAYMLAQLGALTNAESLLTLTPTAPWHQDTSHPSTHRRAPLVTVTALTPHARAASVAGHAGSDETDPLVRARPVDIARLREAISVSTPDRSISPHLESDRSDSTRSDPSEVDPIESGADGSDPVKSSADRVADANHPTRSDRTDPLPEPTRRPGAPAAPQNPIEPGPETTPPPSQTGSGVAGVRARTSDVDRVRDLIRSGEFPPHPAVETIRKRLGISPAYARAARAVITSTPPRLTTPAASNSRRNPAPSQANRNPYIDLTPQPEEPLKDPSPETKTAPSNKAQTSTQPITQGIPQEGQKQTTPMHHGSSRPTKIH